MSTAAHQPYLQFLDRSGDQKPSNAPPKATDVSETVRGPRDRHLQSVDVVNPVFHAAEAAEVQRRQEGVSTAACTAVGVRGSQPFLKRWQQGVVALARGEPTPAPPSSAQRTLQQLAAEAEEDWPTGREADGERLTPVSPAAGSD